MVEPKKRKATQRTQREKVQATQTQPQEIRQEDVTKSENETTANVLKVVYSLGGIAIFAYHFLVKRTA